MLEILGTIVGAVFSGGATGILGVIAQRWADYKNRQLDLQRDRQAQEHEVAMFNANAAVMREEWAARTHIVSVEADAKIKAAEADAGARESEADARALIESIKADAGRFTEGRKLTPRQTWVMVILDAIRGIVRPGLTIYLCVLATLIWNEAQRRMGAISQEQAFEIVKLTVGTVFYLWTTCTLWWFGTRNKGPAPGVAK